MVMHTRAYLVETLEGDGARACAVRAEVAAVTAARGAAAVVAAVEIGHKAVNTGGARVQGMHMAHEAPATGHQLAVGICGDFAMQMTMSLQT